MVISASRRTDIPAFHGKWFIEKLKEGKVTLINPYNNTEYDIDLTPENIDCIVFWTKNPEPFLKYLPELDKSYAYYFQYTVNGYGKDLEPNIPDRDTSIETFKKLSKIIGADRVIWRYDPIIMSKQYDIAYHVKSFVHLCEAFRGYTNRVVISFLDEYDKHKELFKKLKIRTPIPEERDGFLRFFDSISKLRGIKLQTCGEDCKQYAGKCVDDELIGKITGKEIKYLKDTSQRKLCECHKSKDIGSYNTCYHGCKYCYANPSK